MPTDVNLPYPNDPQNGGDFDATPVFENIQQLVQFLQSFPGGNIQAATILEAALDSNINPRLRSAEGFANFVYSGGLPSGFSTFNVTVPGGTAYTSGYRHAITGQSFTVLASKDTYFSVNKDSAIDTPQAVTNGAAQPSLPTDSQWLCKVISNGTTITSIVDLRNLGPVTAATIQNPYKFSVYRNAALSPTSAVVFDKVEFDTGNNNDTGTGKFTAPVAGFYQINAQLKFSSTGSTQNILILLTKNGSTTRIGSGYVEMYTGGTSVNAATLSTLIQLAAGDYLQIIPENSPTLALDVSATYANNYFQGFLVSRT